MENIENYKVIEQKLGMDMFRLDVQPVIDARTNKSVKIQTKMMWVIKIIYRSASATLGLLKTSDWKQAVLIPSDDNIKIEKIKALHIAEQFDTVTPVLSNMDLVDDNDWMIWGDDDPYHLTVAIITHHLKTHFTYHEGPEEHSPACMNALWIGIESMIRHIVDESKNSELSAFVSEHWWHL